MNVLKTASTPQLKTLHRGKVRDSLRVDAKTRLLIVSDRLSAFDRVLDTPIPLKGEVLSRLANWWFEKTADVVPNHVLRAVDPVATLVREVEPIRIEMVVRGYLTGSMGRAYAAGARTFCGAAVPDGLAPNARFPQPLVTPTTKEKNDREISPAEIVSEGWTTAERYAQMREIALRLFERGTRLLAEKGLILVDTKYEFGLLDGQLTLIDEIHTPDSSRMWDQAAYDRDPARVEAHDKEYVRAWLRQNRKDGEYPTALPDDVVRETTRRYVDIFERITGESCPPFKDGTDLLLNLNSSLMMPSQVPAMTVVRPQEAALAALRALNLPRLKDRFRAEIAEIKAGLRRADAEVREAARA